MEEFDGPLPKAACVNQSAHWHPGYTHSIPRSPILVKREALASAAWSLVAVCLHPARKAPYRISIQRSVAAVASHEHI